MAQVKGVDKWLFGIVLLLVLFGLVMVFSASAVMAKANNGSAYHFVAKQAGFALAGLIALLALQRVDYRRFNNATFVYTALAVTFVLLVGVFLVHDSHHTHRWFRLGSFVTFQPSELATPVVILFLAWFLQKRIHLMDEWKETVVPAALPALIFVALILKQPDLGTALVCAAVCLVMLYLAGLQMRWIMIAVACALPVIVGMLVLVPWRLARIKVFLNPDADPRGAGFHIMQSLIAVGTGGIWGRGLMDGVQKLFYLPEPHTDFIFANISEELGLIGAVSLVAGFCFFGYRGMRAAYLSKDPFARFIAFGLTSAILIQAFFNVSVSLALLPTKGITLPFISFGGTSLFVTLACMGVLLNITRETS